MSTIFTRNIEPNTVLKSLDMDMLSNDPVKMRSLANLYLNYMCYEEFSPLAVVPVTEMFGFRPVAPRYWIYAPLRRICIYVEAILDSPVQRFVWTDRKTGNETVLTQEITQDSIVFLEVQGDVLTYCNDKLLFIECPQKLKHPLTVAFIDNYGLFQAINLEMGAWSTTDETVNTFRSISREIEYPLEKIPLNELNVGLSAVPRELRDFLTGFANSLVHFAIFPQISDGDQTRTIDTAARDASVTSNNFTKTYSVAASLQFNTRDTFDLSYQVGELNINDTI